MAEPMGQMTKTMATLNEVKSAVAEVLEVEPDRLTPETNLHDLPAYDSVAVLSLLVALDDIGVEIPQAKASEIRTFDDILKIAQVSA